MQTTKSAKSFQELGSVFGLNGTDVPATKKQPVVKIAKAMPVEEAAQYEVLSTHTGVVIKVPKKSGFMGYEPAFTAANGETVSERWHNGRPLGGSIWLNLYFYGIKKAQLGKRIEATVKVILKTMPDGMQHRMLDVHYTPGASCKCEFKMLPEGDEGILVDERVTHRIYFKPRKHDRLCSQR